MLFSAKVTSEVPKEAHARSSKEGGINGELYSCRGPKGEVEPA